MGSCVLKRLKTYWLELHTTFVCLGELLQMTCEVLWEKSFITICISVLKPLGFLNASQPASLLQRKRQCLLSFRSLPIPHYEIQIWRCFRIQWLKDLVFWLKSSPYFCTDHFLCSARPQFRETKWLQARDTAFICIYIYICIYVILHTYFTAIQFNIQNTIV